MDWKTAALVLAASRRHDESCLECGPERSLYGRCPEGSGLFLRAEEVEGWIKKVTEGVAR